MKMPTTSLVIPKDEAEEKIKSRIDKGRQLLNREINTYEELEEAGNEYSKWSAYNGEMLRQMFDGPQMANEYGGHDLLGASTVDVALGEAIFEVKQYTHQEILRLESILERLDFYDRDAGTENLVSLTPCVFVGHGRSTVWARLKIFLQDELGLQVIYYESESRAGESIIPILEKMLSQATFAILVLTAEDETAAGEKRARQNVIHEAGLFQGRLGFRKAILLRQEGLEDFTNVDGLQYIGFSGERIEQTFYELERVLRREKQIP
jgi:predicted nucleotide-binding protein